MVDIVNKSGFGSPLIVSNKTCASSLCVFS